MPLEVTTVVQKVTVKQNPPTKVSIASSGKQGPKGDRGYSAYQIAVSQGFEGTEQEWLDSIAGSIITEATEAASDANAAKIAAEFAQSLAEDAQSDVAANTSLVSGHRAAVESARDTTFGYRNEAEGFRDEGETYRDETLVYRNETEGLRDSANMFAQDAAASAAIVAGTPRTFEYDEQGDLIPATNPTPSGEFGIDAEGDICPA